jgi:citrate synthase
MPRLDTVLVLLLAIPASSFANANPARNTVEHRQDRRQLAPDRAWAERDAREVTEFESMTAQLRDAMQDRMAARYRDVDEDVLRAMDREIEQAAVKSDQAAHEARVSRRQARNVMGASAGGNTLQAADDQNDRNTALWRHDEMARLGTMAGALQNEVNHGDRTAMRKNLALAEKFLDVMKRDLAANSRERTEDRAELRKDR